MTKNMQANAQHDTAFVTKDGKHYRNGFSGTKPCTDHLGNAYPSRQAMCDAYKIALALLDERLRRGIPLGEALTKPVRKKYHPCTDHLGNSFPSVKAMCDAHGVNQGTYRGRISAGLALEEALAPELQAERPQPDGPCTDHTGACYESVTAMCKAWNISPGTYKSRIKRGIALEEALTAPLGEQLSCDKEDRTGPDGKTYPSVKAMCDAYGITAQAYRHRRKAGWTKSDALLEKTTGSVECTDCFSRVHESISAMCRYLGIASNGHNADKFHGNIPLLEKALENAWKGKDCGPYRNIYPIEFPWFQADMGEYPIIIHFNKILEEYHKNDTDQTATE